MTKIQISLWIQINPGYYKCKPGTYQSPFFDDENPYIVKKCIEDGQPEKTFVKENTNTQINCLERDECGAGNTQETYVDSNTNLFGFELLPGTDNPEPDNIVELPGKENCGNNKYCCPNCNDPDDGSFTCGICPLGYSKYDGGQLCIQNECRFDDDSSHILSHTEQGQDIQLGLSTSNQRFYRLSDFSNLDINCNIGHGVINIDVPPSITCLNEDNIHNKYLNIQGCEPCDYGKYSNEDK